MKEDSLRRYTFKLYPNAAQAEALERHRRMHCDLYNACLQERIDHWRQECQRKPREERRGISFYDQSKSITLLRAELPEFAALSFDSLALTAQRLDNAYKAFFRRARAGAGFQSGFPKFKSGRTYPGFSFRKHRSGWDVLFRDEGPRPRNGSVRFKGVPGRIRFRGRLPIRYEDIRTCDVLWRDDRWSISLVFEMAPRRRAGQGAGEVRFDLVDSFASVKSANGGRAAGPTETAFVFSNGRISPIRQGVASTSGRDPGDSGADHGVRPHGSSSGSGRDPGDSGADIGHLQTARARCKRGSNRYRKLSKRIARLQARDARRRREALHVWTTEMTRQYRDIDVVAPPSIAAETASGRGDARDWGAQVDLKAAMNRRILDQAPAAAIQMLQYKVSEAGGDCRVLEDAEPKTGIGNDIVKATQINRRNKAHARRSQGSHRHGKSGEGETAG